MEADTQPQEKKAVHLGRNTQRIREMIGMKQNVLAMNTGYSQQYISKLEQSESFADEVLEKVASGLGVNPDLIKNFDEDKAVYNIQNNYEGSTLNNSSNYQYNYQPTFNPVDKLMTAIEENKKLYDALLKAEREKIALLEKMLGKQDQK